MKAKRTIIAALVAIMAIGANAQQVTTLYFLENAPMRHTINPAFQPVSQGFINFSPLGWMSFSGGNNSLTMSDIFFVDPTTGMTITPLHPNADRQAFLRQMRDMTMINGEATLGLLNMGFRIKDDGYLTIGINERFNGGTTLPKSMFNFVLGGGMTNLTPSGMNTIALSGLGAGASVYAEVAGGYSHRLNDKWTIGGKFKFLLGQAYMGMNFKNLNINASSQEWAIQGLAEMDIAAPINAPYLASYIDGKNMNQVITAFQDGSFDANKLIDTSDPMALVKNVLTPSGYGAAIDFGFTYKPIENLQITAALTDLGFIYWTNSNRFQCKVDTTFTGAGEIDYSDPAYRDANGNFSTQILMDTVKSNLMGLLNGVRMNSQPSGFARMTSARFNLGVDANFWDNRVGVGVVSATRLYNSRLYEEITLGVAFRPFNWLSIAASYSLMNNGKYSNIGAGLSFMPYDGINLTLAMDYIPTSYAGMDVNGTTKYILPDKTKMVNVALGFSVCWGSNRRDKDKDGVWDKIDLCPNTPRGVEVDSVGCPIDSDHDGVPDYLDNCPNTPAAAIGFVDSVGCELDSDHDGVPDYMDQCPNTPAAAIGHVDSVGCPLDTDGDGVPDYMDRCPNTPAEAYGMVDENGCPLDSDFDGVPDYLDACPNTTPAALTFVDEHGCELDSDNDGVPDYMDECPMVPGVSANRGCPELKREVRQLLQKAMQGIEFESGKATIKRKSYPLLNQIAQIFIDNSDYVIEVQGHTDNTGNAEANQRISEQRANAVMQYLIGKGVPAERMTAVGYGQNVPLADNSTAAGRQKNRRVEFKITFEEVHIETVLDHADPQPEQ